MLVLLEIPAPFSSGLAGVNLKDSYNETVKLSEVPSLQDGSGHSLLSSIEMERSTASFILLDDTWDCIVPIPNNTKHIKSVKKQLMAQ